MPGLTDMLRSYQFKIMQMESIFLCQLMFKVNNTPIFFFKFLIYYLIPRRKNISQHLLAKIKNILWIEPGVFLTLFLANFAVFIPPESIFGFLL